MERPTENDNESWTDTLSKRVGGISLLTLIVCAVVVIISRIRKAMRGYWAFFSGEVND